MQYKWLSGIRGIAILGIIYQRYWCLSGLIVVLWSRGASPAPFYQHADFDTQVRDLLKNEMLTREEIANLSTVFQDLQYTLRTLWPGSEVLPLGSFVTGLASKSSDADCMVKVPHLYVKSDRDLILEAAHLLTRHPDLYDQVRSKVQANRRIPLLKFKYVPTKRNCDVNFISNIALENTRMMGYYLNLDEKFLSLAAILKFWAKVRHLRSTETLATNSLNLLIIFYLQQENIVPPFALLQRHLIRCPVNNWEISFRRMPYNLTNTASLYQLLGGFFRYYSEFNFDEFVVSPLLGRPLRKIEFEDIDSLPEELSLYKNYMKKPNSKPLTLDTKLCVQDAIEQRRNTADVKEYKANKFISHVKFAARIYDVLPKDLFLRVLLANDAKYSSSEMFNTIKINPKCTKRLKNC